MAFAKHVFFLWVFNTEEKTHSGGPQDAVYDLLRPVKVLESRPQQEPQQEPHSWPTGVRL